MIEKTLSTLNKIPKDKAMHSLGGLILYDFLNLFMPCGIAIIFVVIAGVVKEIYDAVNKRKHTADAMDAIATFILPVIFITIEAVKIEWIN